MEYLIISGILIAFLFYCYKKDNYLFAPNQLMGWYWFFQILIIVPLCGFSMWEYTGLGYIVACMVVFSIPFLISNKGVVPSSIQLPGRCSPSLVKCIALITGLGIVVHIVSIFQMYEITLSEGAFHIGAVSDRLYDMKFHGEEKSTLWSRISLILLYSFPLLTGYYYQILKNKCLTLVGFALILYVSLLLGTKAVFMTACLLWIAGWIVASSGERNINIRSYIPKIMLCIISLVVLLVFGMFVRLYGNAEITLESSLRATHNIFANYAFAHLLAFDHWFAGFTWEVFTGGQYTFFGIFNTLGLANREIGIFRDVLYIGSLHTNVYTVFRSIVTDFSPIGGLLFMALLGFIANYAYKKVRLSKESQPLAVTILVMIYAFILWSFVTSIFAYASYICAFVYFYLCQKLIIWRSGC